MKRKKMAAHRLPTIAGVLVVLALIGSSRLLAEVTSTGLVIQDSRGTRVGQVLDVPDLSFVRASFQADEYSIILDFWRQYVSPDSGTINQIEFTSPDCSGQGYMVVDYNFGVPLWDHSAVVGPNATLFAGHPQTPQPIAIHSVLGPFPNGCSATDFEDRLVIPMQRIEDLLPKWQPPFTVVAALPPSSVPGLSTAGTAALVLLLCSAAIFLLRRW
jgi:hypothetical protein